MSLAERLKLPNFKLTTVSWPVPGLASLPAYLRQHSKAAVLIWVAFLLGLLGADLWFTTRQSPVLPIAAVELGPVPLPLVAGQEPRDRALPPAPYPGMVQQTTEGKLPTLAADGTPPYRAYAYPFDRSDARPRITIVVTDVGLQASMLENAVRKLPGSVALAFNAYAPNLDQQLANARQAGHETMLVVPADGLDPASYDPGPGAMRNALTADENMQRLRLIMGRGFGYIGLLLDPRTAVLATPNLAGALLTEGQARGLALLSGNPEFTKMGLAQGSPAVDITLSLDRSLDPAAVDAALAELEQRARESGHVVAITALYPFMTDKLANWLPTLSQKGLALAPLSAVVLEPPASADEPPPSAPHQE